MRSWICACCVLACSGASGPSPSAAETSRLELRTSPLVDLYFHVRSLAARRDAAPPEGYEEVVRAARAIQRTLGSFGGWGPLDSRVFTTADPAELERGFAELPDPYERRGRTMRLRDDALRFAAGIRERWPGFLQDEWPERKRRLDRRIAALEREFLPGHRLALAFMMRSLGVADPRATVPVWIVTATNPPGAMTYRLYGGGAAVVVAGDVGGADGLLAETILHEACHTLDLASTDGASAFAVLRSLLERRGLTPRDELYHTIPHTLMFVQAEETVRRLYDPDHVGYGAATDLYERTGAIADVEREIWPRHLDGELEREPALRRIVEALRPQIAEAFASGFERFAAQVVPGLLEQYDVPGAALALVVDGRVALARGFGVRRAGSEGAVDERTVFQAASLSKPVAAYGAHRLVQRGRLDLDRPLTDYLDGPYVDDPRIGRVTARLVLSHASGLPNWRPGFWGDDPQPLEFDFDPGERFQYSGEGYVLLQRVLERVSGRSLDVFLREQVLEPLGLRDSSFVWDERFETVHATPHDGRGRPQPKQRSSRPLAAGTLQTTAADYARFLQALVHDAPAGEYPLGPTAVRRMLATERAIDARLGWSLGWGVERADDGDVFWQWGDDETFKALAAGSPERGIAIVVLTNGRWGLDVVRPLVERALGPRSFLNFEMLHYRPAGAGEEPAPGKDGSAAAAGP